MSAAGIDFSGVVAAKEANFTEIGTIALFKISKVEFGNTKNTNAYFMKLDFSELNAEKKVVSTFNHSFFLSIKALPRVQSVMVAVTGKELSGSLSEPQLIATLQDKTLALKITANITDQGKVFPTLGYAGFCKPASELQFLSFTSREEKENAAAITMLERSRASNADGGTTTGNSGSEANPFATDEKF